jgi:hypothetical protein
VDGTVVVLETPRQFTSFVPSKGHTVSGLFFYVKLGRKVIEFVDFVTVLVFVDLKGWIVME